MSEVLSYLTQELGLSESVARQHVANIQARCTKAELTKPSYTLHLDLVKDINVKEVKNPQSNEFLGWNEKFECLSGASLSRFHREIPSTNNDDLIGKWCLFKVTRAQVNKYSNTVDYRVVPLFQPEFSEILERLKSLHEIVSKINQNRPSTTSSQLQTTQTSPQNNKGRNQLPTVSLPGSE